MEFHVHEIFNWKYLFLLVALFGLAIESYVISGSLSEPSDAPSDSIKYGSLKDVGLPAYFLNSSTILHSTSEQFLSFSIDSKDIRKNFSGKTLLRNKTLIRMMSYLSPGYLRIGGTEADRLVFKDNTRPMSSHPSPCLDPNNAFVMTGEEWLEIYTFAKQSKLKVLFDLNVLLRKNSNWDWSNAEQLLDFSAGNRMDVDWQLGNEPNSFLHTFNTSLSPITLARDFKTLRNLLNTYSSYKESLLVGPDVTSPRRSHDGGVSIAAERFLQEFVSSGGDEAVDAIAWHHYYLHSNATISDFLNPAVFDSLQFVINKVKDAVEGSRPRSFWITESGSACGGGVALVSHSFVASFLFLDRLGLAARAGISLVVRQSLYSGNYALVDKETLAPNPDWWIAYIYKMLVAPSVLSITPASRVPNTLRLYAHCSRSGSVVVFGVNFSNRSQQLVIRTDSAATTAEFYQLTAPSLLSQKVMVNGKLLKFPDKRKPSVSSVNVNITSPLHLAEHSIFFLCFDNLISSACRTGQRDIDPGVFMVKKK